MKNEVIKKVYDNQLDIPALFGKRIALRLQIRSRKLLKEVSIFIGHVNVL